MILIKFKGFHQSPTGPKSNAMMVFDTKGNKKSEVSTPLFLESSLAIGKDGTAYIGSFAEGDKGAGVYAIADGKIKWYYSIPEKEVWASPAIGKDGTIYVGSISGKFHALNSDGTKKWIFDTTSDVGSSAAIGFEGTIYVGSRTGKIHALNPDGTEKWHYATLSSISSSPAIGSDGTIYVGAYNQKLYAFGNANTGTTIVFNENVSKEQMLTAMKKMGLEYGFNPQLWKNKRINIYFPKGKSEMYTETLLNNHLVQTVGGKKKNKPKNPYDIQPGEWHPKDNNVECFRPKTVEEDKKCKKFCSDHPDKCPGYWEHMKTKNAKSKNYGEKKIAKKTEDLTENKVKKKIGLWQGILNWFRNIFG